MSQSLWKWHEKHRLSFITPKTSVHSLGPDEPIGEQPLRSLGPSSTASTSPISLAGSTDTRNFHQFGRGNQDYGCNICAKFDNNHLLIDKKFAIIFHEVSVAWPKTTPDTSATNFSSQQPQFGTISSLTGLAVPPVSMGENSPSSTMVSSGPNAQATIFNNLTAHIKHHEFVMIVGRVGSGKSSLLMTMLNELPIQSGSIRINGSLSYASQEPWLFSGTIRENITIAWHRRAGRNYRRMPERLENRYQEVLRICCLDRDIEIMPLGDSTNVGERGSALSGGQKARVNLARALFFDADIYLLDDPLSAVDASVAKYIFEECFKTFLKKKTVLLVTHQVQFSTPAQKVLLLYDSPHFSYGPATKVLQSLFKQYKLDPSAAIPTATNEEQQLVQVAVNKQALETPTGPPQVHQQQKSGSTSKQDDGPLGEIETGSQIKSLQSEELLQGLNSLEDILGVNSIGKEQNKRTMDTDSSISLTELNRDSEHLPDSKRTIKQTPSQKNPDSVQSPALRLLAQASLAYEDETLADLDTYLYYRQRAAPFWVIVTFLFSNILTQILFNGTDYFLSAWSSYASSIQKVLFGSTYLEGVENSTQPLASSMAPKHLGYNEEEAIHSAHKPPYVLDTPGMMRLVLDQMASIPGHLLSRSHDNEMQKRPRNDTLPDEPRSSFWSHLDTVCYTYLAIIILLLIASFARNVILFYSCFMASIEIHQETLHGLVFAPMSFFDRNSIGSILARFSSDLNALDDDIPQTAIDVIEIVTNIIGIILVTALVNWYNIFPAFFVIIVADYWRRSSSEALTRLKQIEAVKRGQVFGKAMSTLSGLTTIRVFQLESVINRRFERAQNDHTHAWYSFLTGRHRLTVAIDSTCLIYFSSLIVITLIMVFYNKVQPSLVGLLISQIVIFPGPLQWGARQLTELQSLMTSVARIRDYAQTLRDEQEVMSKPKLEAPPDGWPRQGAIRYDNVTLSYVNGADVLRNVSFEIKGGQRIGIVGRTGAGKSSIIAALFRMTDFRGRILIDDVNTKHISLKHLRSNVSIIPQEPILFTGTIRSNLDPFGSHKDEAIWTALQWVKMKKLVAEMDGGLNAQVSEGGHNFSAGQRQLMCLARAILRKNKILVLDEATANVDPETDAFIQATIREKFFRCTVLTIAHRLHTIMDSDRVLVLEASEVREFDEPYELLKNKDGFLSRMVDSTGGEEAKRLRQIANDIHEKKNRLSKLRDEMRLIMSEVTKSSANSDTSDTVKQEPEQQQAQQQQPTLEQQQQKQEPEKQQQSEKQQQQSDKQQQAEKQQQQQPEKLKQQSEKQQQETQKQPQLPEKQQQQAEKQLQPPEKQQPQAEKQQPQPEKQQRQPEKSQSEKQQLQPEKEQSKSVKELPKSEKELPKSEKELPKPEKQQPQPVEQQPQQQQKEGQGEREKKQQPPEEGEKK